MRHPTDGTLRRFLDEPAGVADADHEHMATCPVCLAGLRTARHDAATAAAMLHLEVTTDVTAGWSRLSQAIAADEPRPRVAASTRGRWWRAARRSPVMAIVAAVALVTGAGVAAAADWLPIFHAERITPVTAAEADLVKLPDLSAFGSLEITEKVDVRAVADAGAARQASGLSVPLPSRLPRGVTGEPRYHVGGRMSAVFTFSAAKSARSAAAAGQTLPPPPAGLDGSRFRLVAGPGVAAVWSKGRGVPSLIVARAVAPAAYSSGIPFTTARDYLLSLPMLSEDIASQLRSFSGDGTTLPLFISDERLASSTSDIGGTPATVLTSRNGVMAAVVWVDDGVVTAVAGSLDTDEVLSVARDLRWDR